MHIHENHEEIAPILILLSRIHIDILIKRLRLIGFDGLTPSIATIIPLLDTQGIRPAALALKAGVSKQAISQLIKILENKDYALQMADRKDTRAKLVCLSQRGEALREACAIIRGELYQIAIQTLGQHAVEHMKRDLSTLMDALILEQ